MARPVRPTVDHPVSPSTAFASSEMFHEGHAPIDRLARTVSIKARRLAPVSAPVAPRDIQATMLAIHPRPQASTGQRERVDKQARRPSVQHAPSKHPALPDPLMGRYKPTNLAKVGLTLSDS
ncbi:hypothetical protein N7498_009085 [Penicillium cinerascens]|uniref:Uncharacterized protein n=1 Tax=Penicillium cinerascens TaxID=70096 RepID=A0A9W9JG14_9EURO|nr:hypothetical protein N7498_009085 [Penicillium cinerascens]